jgi:hypothetical protein
MHTQSAQQLAGTRIYAAIRNGSARTPIGVTRAEFDVAPERATTALFDQIRLHPSGI